MLPKILKRLEFSILGYLALCKKLVELRGRGPKKEPELLIHYTDFPSFWYILCPGGLIKLFKPVSDKKGFLIQTSWA